MGSTAMRRAAKPSEHDRHKYGRWHRHRAFETLTVYGRVAPQATPAPGTYTDTITATLTH